MFSTTAETVLAACAVLARLEPGEKLSVTALSSVVGSTPFYLGKIFTQLSERGVVEGERGRAGGYRLAVSAANLSLLELLGPYIKLPRPMREQHVFCRDCRKPCSVDGHITQACNLVELVLSRTTLADYSGQCPNAESACASLRGAHQGGGSSNGSNRSS